MITIQILVVSVLLSLAQSQETGSKLNSGNQIGVVNFTNFNYMLENLDYRFLAQFQNLFTGQRIANFSKKEVGNYLFLLGKMYIYNILPSTLHNIPNQEPSDLSYYSKSRYMLGYFYLRNAAEKYENGDAYYYLSILEYMKVSPTILIKNNLKTLADIVMREPQKRGHFHHNLVKIVKEWEDDELEVEEIVETLESLAFDMESHHLHNIEHNLFLASVLHQIPAKITLAYLLKEGISTQKNCTSALPYYLSVIKETKVDNFEFPSDYIDRNNFEKELYSGQKLDLSKYGEYDPTVLIHTSMFDEDSLTAYEEVAMRYLTGEDGYTVNETLSADMFERIHTKSRMARMMLGFLYLKGRGVPKNFNRARQLFEADQKTSKVVRETLLVMKYYSLGFSGQSERALAEMSVLYSQYERRTNMTAIRDQAKLKQHAKRNNKAAEKAKDNPNTKNTEKKDGEAESEQQQEEMSAKQILKSLKEKKQTIRTPMIKFLIGSLILSEEIKGIKENAIFLIDEAAKQGNTLALTMMGLLMLDGSDTISFDCQRATNYFSKQALSHSFVQQRIQMAKIGIKKGHYMFSFIKYVQLMMVGYRNSFINALYLTQVYKNQLLLFDEMSWSITQAKKNQVYRFLVKQDMIDKITTYGIKELGLDNYNLFTEKNFQYLTGLYDGQAGSSASLSEYQGYINRKITSIGIVKHDISILKFFKYKQTKDISTLHELANLGENSPHIFESRFLLGRYYHHTNLTSSQEAVRIKRAMEEYNRATKSSFLGSLIFVIEGGELKESDKVLSHLYTYLAVIIVLGMGLYWKKNKKMQEIFELERKKQEEQARLLNKDTTEQPEQPPLEEVSELKKNEFMFSMGGYKGPKFSEQVAENMISERNLMSISFMMDEKRRNLESETVDPNQPLISEDNEDDDDGEGEGEVMVSKMHSD